MESVPDVLDVSDYWDDVDAESQRMHDAAEYVSEGYYESIDAALDAMEVRPYPVEEHDANGHITY